MIDLKCHGTARDKDCVSALCFYFNRRVTDDELRYFDEVMKRAAHLAPLAAHDAAAEEKPLSDRVQIGRLALRVEGDWWNAYYALPDTMEGALHLGSIRLEAVADEKRKRAFMDLMRGVVGSIIKDNVGIAPTWGGERRAPEHERSGKA